MDYSLLDYIEFFFTLFLFIYGLLSTETKKKHGCIPVGDIENKSLAGEMIVRAANKRKEKSHKKKKAKTIRINKKRNIILLACPACGSNIENDKIEISGNSIYGICSSCDQGTSFEGKNKQIQKNPAEWKEPDKDISLKNENIEIIRCQSCAMPIEPAMVSKQGKFLILNCIYCGAVHYIKK